MKITICGSMSANKKMQEIKEYLKFKKLIVCAPEKINDSLHASMDEYSDRESSERKIKYDLIRQHYNQIKNSDCILVINIEKNGKKNYIGANTFLEIGFAYILNKKIYLYNPIPKYCPYYQEIAAMQPFIINGNLDVFTHNKSENKT